MKKSRKLLIISIFYIACSMFSTSVKAEKEVTTYVVEDTYIAQAYPSTSFGSETSFKIGFWGGWETEAYFKFNISEIPKERNDIQQAIIIFEITFLNGSMSVDLVLTDTTWDENLDWNSQPSRQNNLYSFSIDSARKYSSDITNGLNMMYDDSLAVCLYKNGGGNFMSTGWTSEHEAASDSTPRIEWKVTEEFVFPWHIVLPIIAIVAVSAASVVIVRKRRSGRGRGSKDDVSLRTYDGEPVLAGRYDSIKKSSGSIQESVCLFCGLRNRSRTGYCKGCGNPLSS
jgi:hypothetical protein